MSQLFFCERFHTSCCILLTNLKNQQLYLKLLVFGNQRRNTTASTETLAEN